MDDAKDQPEEVAEETAERSECYKLLDQNPKKELIKVQSMVVEAKLMFKSTAPEKNKYAGAIHEDML
eukprot:1774238-Alexandrium_andersonii.AAC.1